MSDLSDRIAAALGAEVTGLRPLHGGDLSDVRRADLSDGRSVVAKTGPVVDTEARMLQKLGQHAPAPQVLHAEPSLLLLEYLEETPPSDTAWSALGTALCQLHGHCGDMYGWPENYAFGSLHIPNTQADDWHEFFAENRLLAGRDSLDGDLRARIETLCANLPDMLPPKPSASLLHGDLWSGNLLFSGDRGYLIDPASYYGHAEIDLAMLTLFGRPPAAFWEGYGPLSPGAVERRAVYQLWPALVHLRLFGSGYRSLVCDLLDRCGA
ncbi:fructosamine kinase family protein [Roseovarius aestuariivivens]|uniref:fructosamine kinase family protein n=1 Tax=Roseovarius aestuariivivens TaxID=1888910 RepID=UPI001080401D|nr:fructosamine kinase family protein [Roseovarius aestuariivivens]